MRRLIIGMGCAGLAAAAAAFATGCGELSTGCAATEECVSADASTPDASDATTDRGVDAPAGNEGGEGDGAIDAPISSEAGMDGGSDADSGDASPPPVCDLDASPHDSPCVAGKDMGGVFVAPATAGGKDGAGRGTKGAPYATLGYALGHLGSSGRVYVCGATFAEAVTIGAPAQVYGGLDCAADAASPATWAPIDGGSSTFAGPANVPALWVKGVTGSVAIEDTQFVAAPGDGYDDAGNGQSSIAVFASNSTDVTLRRCVLQAGEAHAGSDGVAVAAFDAGAPSGLPGTDDAGGDFVTNACGSTVSVGGGGGSPSDVGQDGTTGTPGSDNSDSVADCMNGAGGRPGINGDGGAGGDGAAAFGTLSSSGWLPVSGEPGAAGSVGQGGGGGASVDPSGGGGGGGAGGCGGAGGAGGGGGGSSFAVVVFQSGLDLVSCQLSAGDGGAGGRGADGQVGQSGGAKGAPFGGNACQGGHGGYGGGGGGGGGGASGLSAAVIWSGSTAPTIDGVSLVDAGTRAAVKQVGAYGAPGAHGAGATAAASGASPGADGTDGKAGSGTPPAVVQLP